MRSLPHDQTHYQRPTCIMRERGRTLDCETCDHGANLYKCEVFLQRKRCLKPVELTNVYNQTC